MKKVNSFIYAVAFMVLSALSLSMVMPFNTVAVFMVLLGASIVMSISPGEMTQGKLSALLFRQIWINQLMTNFYSAAGHLMRSQDMSALVDNNTINLAEIGADPEVLVNNNVWPVPFAERADTPLALPLDHHLTTGTVVRNIETAHLSYAKVESVVAQHRRKLANYFNIRATYNWSPAQNGTYNKVAAATGATRVDGKKGMKLADLTAQQEFLDLLDVPQEGRIAVLTPQHRADLMNESSQLFQAFVNLKTGEVMNLAGFEIYVSSATPKYNKDTGVKKAFAAEAAGTDTYASIFYHETEVVRCDGTTLVNTEPAGVTQGGDLFNAEKWFLGLPIRSKYAGAVYSPTA